VSNRPLLTILIPTRNRPSSLFYAVSSSKSFLNSSEVEIIVISNGESLESDLENLSAKTLENIKVIRSPQRLGMSENWSFGLDHATGVWFTVLGDDDLIASSVLDSLLQVLSTYSNSTINGVKTRVSGFVWESKCEREFPGEYRVASSDTTFSVVSIDRNLTTLEVQPHRYPTGSAGSFLRTDWVKNLGSNLTYQSISPDWYTGYLFFLLNEDYIAFNGQVIACGVHPRSSITQMKRKGEDFLMEVVLSKNVGNVVLKQKFSGGFPTTWLARVDALLQAHQSLKIQDTPSWRTLVRLSYATTPRYVYKVYRVQSRAFPEFGLRHTFWLIQFLVKSLAKWVNDVF
jgi:glycosyltransferase involved in cell wall biosynthesis